MGSKPDTAAWRANGKAVWSKPVVFLEVLSILSRGILSILICNGNVVDTAAAPVDDDDNELE